MITIDSMVVESTVGDVAVGVCDMVNAVVGGADKERTPVNELELLQNVML